MFAIDARTGAKKWAWDPKISRQTERVYCCGAINRGLAMMGDYVYVGTLDARLVALRKATGEVAWETQVIDWQQGYSITGAPLAIKDMVLTGVAGGDFGIRGFIKAFDAKTGKLRWTAYTIPGPGGAGNETWPGDTWKNGGAPTWVTGSYDPELNLVYWNTGRLVRWRSMCQKRPALFKGRHFEPEIIMLCVRRYLRFSLSYRNLEELMAERNLSVDHVTIWRWIQRYAPELERRCRRELRMTNRSWRVDETYVRVAGKWTYLYRAVDSMGDTIDFLLSPNRDVHAAKRFFQKALRAPGHPRPRVINVDGNPSYPKVIAELKQTGELGRRCRCRPVRYLNNVVEQDHRAIKRRVRVSQGFRSFDAAWRTIQGIETINMIRKGQVRWLPKHDIVGQVAFIASLFGVGVAV